MKSFADLVKLRHSPEWERVTYGEKYSDEYRHLKSCNSFPTNIPNWSTKRRQLDVRTIDLDRLTV